MAVTSDRTRGGHHVNLPPQTVAVRIWCRPVRADQCRSSCHWQCCHPCWSERSHTSGGLATVVQPAACDCLSQCPAGQCGRYAPGNTDTKCVNASHGSTCRKL